MHCDIQPFAEYAVTPFVGVWIETQIMRSKISSSYVTPFVGVWIETYMPSGLQRDQQVTPFVGVWIETLKNLVDLENLWSHPSWVCGLKPAILTHMNAASLGHTLRGCVD